MNDNSLRPTPVCNGAGPKTKSGHSAEEISELQRSPLTLQELAIARIDVVGKPEIYTRKAVISELEMLVREAKETPYKPLAVVFNKLSTQDVYAERFQIQQEGGTFVHNLRQLFDVSINPMNPHPDKMTIAGLDGNFETEHDPGLLINGKQLMDALRHPQFPYARPDKYMHSFTDKEIGLFNLSWNTADIPNRLRTFPKGRVDNHPGIPKELSDYARQITAKVVDKIAHGNIGRKDVVPSYITLQKASEIDRWDPSYHRNICELVAKAVMEGNLAYYEPLFFNFLRERQIGLATAHDERHAARDRVFSLGLAMVEKQKYVEAVQFFAEIRYTTGQCSEWREYAKQIKAAVPSEVMRRNDTVGKEFRGLVN